MSVCFKGFAVDLPLCCFWPYESAEKAVAFGFFALLPLVLSEEAEVLAVKPAGLWARYRVLIHKTARKRCSMLVLSRLMNSALRAMERLHFEPTSLTPRRSQ